MNASKINQAIARLERFTDRSWYLPVVGGLAFLDFFIGVVPTDGLLISTVMLQPQRWLRAAVIVTWGSALGSLAVAAVVQSFGAPLIDWALGPEVWNSGGFVRARELLEAYGAWAIFLMAIGPLPLVPFSIIAGMGGTGLTELFVASLVGRAIKYTLFSWLSAKAPHLLRRFMKGPQKEAEEILSEKPPAA
jgi:membrane protein YqaA with SNARE-associated domain